MRRVLTGLAAGGVLALVATLWPTLGALGPQPTPTTDPSTESQAVAAAPAASPEARATESTCLDADGALGGVHTKLTVPTTWHPSTMAGPTDLTCFVAKERAVGDAWVSVVAAGHTLSASTAKDAALQAFRWVRATSYPADARSSDPQSQPSIVKGRPAHIQAATLTPPTGPADRLTVMAVQNPDATFDVLITAATVGDASNTAEIDAMWRSLETR